jgi:23S rRNA (guanine745-N1)-methyltransferase
MIRPGLLRTPLACPIDGLALEVNGQDLACARKHNYNVSRYGYVNLLPVGLKPSKDPGDSRAMVEARRAVLDNGMFEPLAHALADVVCSQAQSIESHRPLLVDAGCGEGYYTDALQTALGEHSDVADFTVLGVDISKWAITAAARRYANAAWAVGNNKRLPVLEHSANIITSLFGFATWQPWAELQTAGQIVVTANAGPQHLIELRELVYDRVRIHSVADDAEAKAADYQRTGECRIEFIHAIDETDISSKVLMMTPHGHRVAATTRTSLDTATISKLSIDVLIRVYQRS